MSEINELESEVNTGVEENTSVNSQVNTNTSKKDVPEATLDSQVDSDSGKTASPEATSDRFELPKDFVPPKPASHDEAKKTLADLKEGKSVSNEAMASCVQCKELTPDERGYLADMSVSMSLKSGFAEMLNAKTDSEKAKIKTEHDHDFNCWKFVKNEMRSDRFNHLKIAEERRNAGN